MDALTILAAVAEIQESAKLIRSAVRQGGGVIVDAFAFPAWVKVYPDCRCFINEAFAKTYDVPYLPGALDGDLMPQMYAELRQQDQVAILARRPELFVDVLGTGLLMKCPLELDRGPAIFGVRIGDLAQYRENGGLRLGVD